jgi:hypothetical protein
MSDLLERLRRSNDKRRWSVTNDAADEIERLLRAIEERNQELVKMQAVLDAALAWYDDPYAERGAGTGALADAVESYRSSTLEVRP